MSGLNRGGGAGTVAVKEMRGEDGCEQMGATLTHVILLFSSLNIIEELVVCSNSNLTTVEFFITTPQKLILKNRTHFL